MKLDETGRVGVDHAHEQGLHPGMVSFTGMARSHKKCSGLISLDTSIGGKSTDRGVIYEP